MRSLRNASRFFFYHIISTRGKSIVAAIIFSLSAAFTATGQQASSIKILPVSGSVPTTTTPFIFTWNSNSSANNVLVVVSDSTSTFTPSNNNQYTANTDVGAGTDVGTGTGVSKVVYNGASSAQTTATISNLTAGNAYFIQIFEYTGTLLGGDNDEVYNVKAATNNPLRLKYYLSTPAGKWWTPASVTAVEVQAWGGGAAGSGRSGGDGGSGGGGGGGYSEAVVTVTPATGYTVTIAGTAASTAGGGGSSGGQTWFSPTNLAGATIVANGGTVGGEGGSGPPTITGGSGGAGATAGTATGSSSVTNTGGNGGAGSAVATGVGGPGGSSAGAASGANGVNEPSTWASATASTSNPSGSGRGGDGGANDATGNPGNFPGGGGGGAGSDEGPDADLLGGTGASGLLIVSYQPPAVLNANTSTTTQIKVKFNTTITSVAQANGSGFTVTGATITAAAIDGGDATVVNLTVNALSSNFSCASCLSVAAGAVSSAGGSNTLISSQAVSDGVGPTSAATYTKNFIKNGSAQTVTLTFSELLTGTPKVTIVGGTVGTLINNQDMTIGANASIWTYAAGSIWANEAEVFTVTVGTATDASGNVVNSTPASNTFTVDNSAPAAASITAVTTNAGGNVVAGYYNSTNNGGITISVTIAADATLVGGTLEIEVNNQDDGTFTSLISGINIPASGTTQNININHATLSGNGEYGDGKILSFRANINDNAGNGPTQGSTFGSTLTVDLTAPTNQDAVLTASSSMSSGGSVSLTAGTATDFNFLAPTGTTAFTANGTTITTAAGNATSITAPTTAGTYHLYVVDPAGNYSTASTSTVTVVSPPSTNSTIGFSNVTDVSMTVTLTGGNGARRMVIAQFGSAITADPADFTAYTANSDWNNGSPGGTAVGSGFVVYDGTGTSFNMTNLVAGTYHFACYDYNGASTSAGAFNLTQTTGSQATAAQASNITITTPGTTSMAFSWTNGGGTARMVIVKTAGAVFIPSNNNTYTANTDFGSTGGGGTDLNGASAGTVKCVYVGTGTTVTVTDLVENTAYTFQVYEYTGSAGSEVYFLSSATNNPFNRNTVESTQPSTQAGATGFSFTNVTGTSFTIEVTTPGNGSDRMVLVSTAGLSIDPTDGVSYTANTDYSAGSDWDTGAPVAKVIGFGNGPFTVTSLSADVTYTVSVFEFNGTQGTGAENYFNTERAWTRNTEPSSQAAFSAATSVSVSGMTLNWTNGNGDRRIVVMREGSAVNLDPTDRTAAYSANDNANWGARSASNEIGTGNYVVYDGTGASIAITNLHANTTYHYAIYEYNSNENGAQTSTSVAAFLTPAGTGSQATSTDSGQPTTFTTGTVTAKGGREIAGYVNLTNSTLEVIVPLQNSDPTLDDGTIQLQFKNNSGTFNNITNGLFTIPYSDRSSGSKTVSVALTDVDDDPEYADGQTFQITAIITDYSGNARTGGTSGTNTIIDLTAPSIVGGAYLYSDAGLGGSDGLHEVVILKLSEPASVADNTTVLSTNTSGQPGFYIAGGLETVDSKYEDDNTTTSVDASFDNTPHIYLESSADLSGWTTATSIVYTPQASYPGTGNFIRDAAGNELGAINTTLSSSSTQTTLGAASNALGSPAGLATSPLANSTTNKVVFAFSLTSTATLNLTSLTINKDTVRALKNFRLYSNPTSDNYTSGAGIHAFTPTVSTTSVSFTGLSIPLSTSTRYFYLVADVYDYYYQANPTLGFSLTTSGLTVSSGGKTGTTQTGSTYSFSDTDNPGIVSITNSVNPIYLGALTQTVTIRFDEPMNNGTSPSAGMISITGANNWGAFSGGAWSTTSLTNDTYTVNITHNGNSQNQSVNSTITTASGITDWKGRTHPTTNSAASFLVDTERPTTGGANIYADASAVTLADNTIRVTVQYSETMNTSVAPTISFSSGSIPSGPGANGSWTTTDDTNDTYSADFTDAANEEFTATISANNAQDFYGNTQNVQGTSASTINIDTKRPTVLSLNRVSSTPNNSSTLTWRVIFDEGVTSFDDSDIAINITQNPSLTVSTIGVNTVNAQTYDIVLYGVSGDGTISLDVKTSGAGATIDDVYGNGFTAGFTGQSIVVDQTAPTYVSITRQSPVNPWSTTGGTSATSTVFRLEFSEDVTGIEYSGSAKNTKVVSYNTTVSSFSGPLSTTSNYADITANGISGEGPYSLWFYENDDVTDLAGNPVGGTGGSDFYGSITSGNEYYTKVFPEPTDDVTSLTVSASTSTSVTLQWGSPTATPNPTHFLVMAKPHIGGSYPLTTGSEDGNYIADGALVQNILRTGTTSQTATFNNLSSGVEYDFIIYPYTLYSNGNPGSITNDNIDYKTTSPATTLGTYPSGVQVNTAQAGIMQSTSTPVPISSLMDGLNGTTPDDALKATAMQFRVYDDGFTPITTVMSLAANGLAQETITFKLKDELSLAEGASVTGFTSSTGSVASAIYSGKGTTNLITLTNGGANGTWTQAATTISYSGGNVSFISTGSMQNFTGHPVISITPTVQTISTAGTSSFTVPSDVTKITVEAWGGGGSGGIFYNASATFGGGSGGGGGGAYSRSLVAVTPGGNYDVVVGAGGAGISAAASGTIHPGGASSFKQSSTTLVSAAGGGGGYPSYYFDYYTPSNYNNSFKGIGGLASAGIGDIKYSGGNGGYGGGDAVSDYSGGLASGGGGGSSAGTGANGNVGADGYYCTTSPCYVSYGSPPSYPPDGGYGGYGFSTYDAGAYGTSYLNAAYQGGPGGGGGGISGNFASGAGANGQVRITYSVPSSAANTFFNTDNAPFKFKQLVINQQSGTANSDLIDNWTEVLEGAELSDGSTTLTGVIGTSTITFGSVPSPIASTNPGDFGYIADVNSTAYYKDYTLKIWLKNALSDALAAQVDNLILGFAVSPGSFVLNDASNNQKSTQFAAAQSTLNSSNAIDVDATILQFSAAGSTSPINTNPQNSIGVGTPFSANTGVLGPVVYALDVNNNLDKDFAQTGTVVNSLSPSITSSSFVAGKLDLRAMQLNAQGTDAIQVQSSGVATATSTNVTAVITGTTTISASADFVETSEQVSSLSTASTTAEVVFDFTISDDVGADAATFFDNDGLPTLLDSIHIAAGSGNDAVLSDWIKAIQGAELTLTKRNGSTVSILATAAANVVIRPTYITFKNIAYSAATSPGRINDGEANVYTLKIYLKSPVDPSIQDLIDNKDFVFSIANTNLLPTGGANASSTLTASNTNSGDGNNTVDVDATQLDFTTQWAAPSGGVYAQQSYDAPLSPTTLQAKARDVNQNLDLDWNTAGSIATAIPATYPLANTTVTLNNGVFDFDNSLQVTSGGGGANNAITNLVLSSAGLTSGNTYSFQLKYSSSSDIVRETGFSYPTNIDYANANNQATDLTTSSNGTALDRYTIRDGGGTVDADGTPTTLQSITFKVTNWQYLRKLALYNVGSPAASPGTLIASSVVDVQTTATSKTGTQVAGVWQPGSTALITFSGLTGFSAPDIGTRDNNFEVRASFMNSVIDNEVVTFQVWSVSSAGVSSSFADPDLSDNSIASVVSGNQNKIEVTATKLTYTNPTADVDASINVNFNPNGSPVRVEARDIHDMLDLDFNSTITDLTVPTAGVNMEAGGVALNAFGADASGGIEFGVTAFSNGVYLFPSTFQYVSGVNDDDVSLSISAGGLNNYSTDPPAKITLSTSFESSVLKDPSFTAAARINYIATADQAAAITSVNSYELDRWLLIDGNRSSSATGFAYNGKPIDTPSGSGDGTLDGDDDGAGTNLETIQFEITGISAIKKIGLFNGNTLIGTATPIDLPYGTAATTLTWGVPSATLYSAGDNQIAPISLRVIFRDDSLHLLDLDDIQVRFVDASLGVGSQFYVNTGYVAGQPADAGRSVGIIDAVATKIDFITPGSAYVGPMEPIGKNLNTDQPFVSGALPSTDAPVLMAKDANNIRDLDFDVAKASITVTPAGSGTVTTNGVFNNFNDGILHLDGMVYDSFGDGTLTVQAGITATGTLTSNAPPHVDVISVSLDEDKTNYVGSTNLQGGLVDLRIFGVKFTPNHYTDIEPALKGFTISFDTAYQTSTYTTFTAFKVVDENGSDITTSGSYTGTTVTKASSKGSTTELDQVIVDFNGSDPQLFDPSFGTAVPRSFFLLVTTDVGVSSLTPQITPRLLDSGYDFSNLKSSKTDSAVLLTSGTVRDTVICSNTYTFATTNPPVLLTSKESDTEPFKGQLNVARKISQITLQWNVKVWTLEDTAAYIYDVETDERVAYLTAKNGIYVDASTPTVDSVVFDIHYLTTADSMKNDGVYYVAINKGVKDDATNTQTGFSDEFFNFYGGTSFSGDLWFKISSLDPPYLHEAKSYFANYTTGAFSTRFDKAGTAYYLVLDRSLLTTGYTAPDTAQIRTGTYPLVPTSVVTSSSFVIDQVSPYPLPTSGANNALFESFNASLVAGRTYDIWIYAKSEAQPKNVVAAAPYGGSTSSYAIGGAGPTLQIVVPTAANIKATKIPDYSICPNTVVKVSEPIVISEVSSGQFSQAGLQDFYILLPAGFEFDSDDLPEVYLNGDDFDQSSKSVTRLNNTIIRVQYKNFGSTDIDNIVITNIPVEGTSGSQGDILRFGGTANLPMVASNKLATITVVNNAPVKFTNSYTVNGNNASSGNRFTDLTIGSTQFFGSDVVIRAIPQNYVDPTYSDVKLIPSLTSTNDYSPSTFDGKGVTNDLLDLGAVQLGTQFSITMSHDAADGCFLQSSENYVVYDSISPISLLIGRTQAGNSVGYQQGLKNDNFNALDSAMNSGYMPALTFSNTGTPRLDSRHLTGYRLEYLHATIPDGLPAQPISDSAWLSQIRQIPVEVNAVTDVKGTERSYMWNYNKIINAHQDDNTIPEPYDYFFKRSPDKMNSYWQGGSLGKIEFTGVYRSTADPTFLVPFRQRVEIFLPPRPIIEVAGGKIDLGGGTLESDTVVFCNSDQTFTLQGWPDKTTINGTFTYSLFDGITGTPITISDSLKGFSDSGNGKATIDPTLFRNRFRSVRVDYTVQQTGSPSYGTGSTYIRISPNPLADFSIASQLPPVFGDSLNIGFASGTDAYCQAIPIDFTSADSADSYADGDATTAANKTIDFGLNKYTWNFGDLNSGKLNSATAIDTVHTFNDLGRFTVVHTVTNEWGCSNQTTYSQDVTVGSFPSNIQPADVPFTMDGVSIADSLRFTSQLEAAVATNSISTVNQWMWASNSGLGIDSDDKSEGIKFSLPGPDTVTLIAITSLGCVKAFERPILVLDTAIATTSNPYWDDFDGSETRKWHVRQDFDNTATPSWAVGTPASGRTTINSTVDNSTTNKLYATGLTGVYQAGERSFLYSPVLDFSEMTRPMISFDAIWDLNRDGVVFEYSIDTLNAADPLKVWTPLGTDQGTNANGVDWFNELLIGSEPGSNPNGYGWSLNSSSTTRNWVEPKHDLSDISNGRNRVAFRFAFASNNPGGDGFAFDNFRIGERTRVVVVESFTNSSTANSNTATESQFLKDNMPTSSNPLGITPGSDYVKLNYHVGFPTQDPFNLDNPADPSARSLFYGISSTPSARIDGEDFATTSTPYLSGWGRAAYDRNTLKLAEGEIKVDYADQKNGAFKVKVTVQATKAIPAETYLHVVLVEKGLITLAEAQPSNEPNFEYVVRKMLPSASGRKFANALAPGETLAFDTVSWVADKLYAPVNDMAAIIFIQAENGKILQSTMVSIDDPTGVITGIENPFKYKNINIYPNPADQELNIVFPNTLEVDAPIVMADQMGRITHNTIARKGELSVMLRTEGLSQGLYVLQINLGEGRIGRFKVIINHKE